ncbi:hypothetical protein HHE02_13980 [Helicobacter heilmannii]|nr:hypothetical protein HHE02_13980 [Helicobacter heilmannii]CRF49394.1 hypothetical protein HHE03_10060 [Helicobacter heilmannii]CRF51384.1 hypothetical protein HHE06_12560 [Helicobacter heilmannii]
MQLNALDMLEMQRAPGIREKEVPLNTLGAIFDTNYTKHTMLLELVSVALANSRMSATSFTATLKKWACLAKKSSNSKRAY